MTDAPALDLPQLRGFVDGLAQIDWDVAHNGTGLHTIHVTTPAGITYLSTAPPAPGHDRRLSLVETHLAAKLEAA